MLGTWWIINISIIYCHIVEWKENLLVKSNINVTSNFCGYHELNVKNIQQSNKKFLLLNANNQEIKFKINKCYNCTELIKQDILCHEKDVNLQWVYQYLCKTTAISFMVLKTKHFLTNTVVVGCFTFANCNGYYFM